VIGWLSLFRKCFGGCIRAVAWYACGHGDVRATRDLNKATDQNPLSEPRCHLHPGLEDARIPISLHDPFEILDRIFFVLEKSV
jgi:hypothetical protein